MGNDGGYASHHLALRPTGFGVSSTGRGGTSTALTAASGADSITVTAHLHAVHLCGSQISGAFAPTRRLQNGW